jgi:hypothetical protein
LNGSPNFPFRALTTRALADPFGAEALAVLAGRLPPAVLRARLPVDDAPSHEMRAFLPLCSSLLSGSDGELDHPERHLLHAARLHETLRLEAIDRVAEQVGAALRAVAVPVRVIGDLARARFYPERSLRHVHVLVLWVGEGRLADAAAALEEAGLIVAGSSTSSIRRMRHANGCNLLLTAHLAPPGFEWIETVLEPEVLTREEVPAEVELVRIAAELLAFPDKSAAQSLIDAHFLAPSALLSDRLGPLAAMTGLLTPVAALIEASGHAPLALPRVEGTLPRRTPARVLRRIARAAWRRNGCDPLTLFRDAQGADGLLIAGAVVGLTVGALTRRLTGRSGPDRRRPAPDRN